MKPGIDHKELRVWNWVFNGYYIQVDEGYLWALYLGNVSCNPIPLTTEILEKAGFEEIWEDRWQKGLVDIESTPVGFILLNGEERSAWAHRYLFLHQLQNLYYALTSEELEYQPSK